MNIKKQSNTLRSYGTPSIFKGIQYWYTQTNENEELHWFYRNPDSGISYDSGISAADGNFKEITSLPNLIQTARSFQENLELLNNRINTIHKELSYWDLYRITQSVDSEEVFPSVVSGLAVGNSAVINTESSFSYAGQAYHRGDVIVKINESEEILVPAQNIGVYKPSDISPVATGSSTYNITYTYTAAAKEGDTVSATASFSNSNTYGNIGILESTASSFSFPKEFYTLGTASSVIKPVIKLFLNQEEIINDYFTIEGTEVSASSFTYKINTSEVDDLLPVGRSITIQVK